MRSEMRRFRHLRASGWSGPRRACAGSRRGLGGRGRSGSGDVGQDLVELAVAATIEPVAGGTSGAGRQGAVPLLMANWALVPWRRRLPTRPSARLRRRRRCHRSGSGRCRTVPPAGWSGWGVRRSGRAAVAAGQALAGDPGAGAGVVGQQLPAVVDQAAQRLQGPSPRTVGRLAWRRVIGAITSASIGSVLAWLRPRRRAWAVSWVGPRHRQAAVLQGEGGLAAQATGAFDADAVGMAGERPGDQVGVAGWVVGEAGLGDGSAVGSTAHAARVAWCGSMPMRCTWAPAGRGWPPGAAHTWVDPGRAAPIKRHRPAELPEGPSNGKPRPGRARRCLRHCWEQATSNTHVVLLGQDGGDQPDRGRAVGKDPHDVGAAADLAVESVGYTNADIGL
jgi:hypothetical protein